MNTATWLQSTPAVALIDYYLHSAQHGLPKQRAEANEAAIQRWIDDMPEEVRSASRAQFNALLAENARLSAQVEELTAGALVRAHRQCIAVEALIAIRDMATNEEIRQIARRAVAQIEEVTK